LSCKAVARKCRVQPCQLRDWKKNREGILEKAAAIKDITSKHQFLSKVYVNEGRKPATKITELERVKEVYDNLREREQVVTLSLLAHDLQQHNVSLKDPRVCSVRRRVYQHLVKQGAVWRRITRVGQNTRYMTGINKRVPFSNIEYIELAIYYYTYHGLLSIKPLVVQFG
jgi:hypothetical protein